MREGGGERTWNFNCATRDLYSPSKMRFKKRRNQTTIKCWDVTSASSRAATRCRADASCQSRVSAASDNRNTSPASRHQRSASKACRTRQCQRRFISSRTQHGRLFCALRPAAGRRSAGDARRQGRRGDLQRAENVVTNKGEKSSGAPERRRAAANPTMDDTVCVTRSN